MSAAAAVEWSLLAERIGNEVDMETESQEWKERERRKREREARVEQENLFKPMVSRIRLNY